MNEDGIAGDWPGTEPEQDFQDFQDFQDWRFRSRTGASVSESVTNDERETRRLAGN